MSRRWVVALSLCVSACTSAELGVVDASNDSIAPPERDAGLMDTGAHDAGAIADDAAMDAVEPIDTSVGDTGPIDAGTVDAALVDMAPLDAGPIDAGPIDLGPSDTGPIDLGPIDAGPIDATIFFDDFDDDTVAPWNVVHGDWTATGGELVVGPSCVWGTMPCADGESPTLVQSPPIPSGDAQYRLEVDFTIATAVPGRELLRFGVRPASPVSFVPPDTDAGTGGSYTPWFPDTMMLTRAEYLNLCVHCFRPEAMLYEQLGAGVIVGTRYHARIDACADAIAMEVSQDSDGAVVWTRTDARDARSIAALPQMVVFVLGEGPGHSVDDVRVTAGCQR